MSLMARAFAIATLLLVQPAFAVEPDAPNKLLSKDSIIAGQVRMLLSDKKRVRGKTLRAGLNTFYESRDFALLWFDKDGLGRHGKDVIAEIEKADDYGLRSSDYKLPSLSSDGFSGDSFGLAEADVKLSIAAVRYARHARGGRINPRALSGYLDVTLNLPEPEAVLTTLLETSEPDSYLRGLHPKRPEFEALRKLLLARRGGSVKREGPAIPAGPTLRTGSKHDHVTLLRKRLKLSDNSDDPTLFDEAVLDAVKAFQKTKGLQADGIVGPGTRRILNGRTRGGRVTNIVVNMERWRWYPNDLGKFHLQMNIPEQMVRAVKNEKVIYSARTVIGKLTNQTPIFTDVMEFLVFNPTWNVPNSIKVGEILPYLTKNSSWFFDDDPDILKVHNLFMKQNGKDIDPSKVDWKTVDIKNYHVYQPPGPKNVLGMVKFMFPNRHAVYMHDTTEKQYFQKNVRNYSHGCVRIQDADKFAQFLLAQDKGWPASRVMSVVARGSEARINLAKKIPVYLTYFTAKVGKNGKLQTYADIYGHDRRMAAALRMRGRVKKRPRVLAQAVVKKQKPKKKKAKPEPITLMSILDAF